MNSKKKDNSWKKRDGMVFSTNPDYCFTLHDHEDVPSLMPAQQKLRVRIERQGRGGKVVTIVDGFQGTEEQLLDLGKQLKVKCGTGGSVKEGVAIIQGECKDKVVTLLKGLGYTGTK